MRKNPHVRICGGLGSATTLVYPTTTGHHRHPRRCHRTTIARRPATRTRGWRTEAQESRTAAQDVPVLPLACGPARRPALSRTLPWTMLAQRKHFSYSGSGGGAGVDPPKSPYFLILQENRNARFARNAQKPWSRYKTGTVNLRRTEHAKQQEDAPACVQNRADRILNRDLWCPRGPKR